MQVVVWATSVFSLAPEMEGVDNLEYSFLEVKSCTALTRTLRHWFKFFKNTDDNLFDIIGEFSHVDKAVPMSHHFPNQLHADASVSSLKFKGTV